MLLCTPSVPLHVDVVVAHPISDGSDDRYRLVHFWISTVVVIFGLFSLTLSGMLRH